MCYLRYSSSLTLTMSTRVCVCEGERVNVIYYIQCYSTSFGCFVIIHHFSLSSFCFISPSLSLSSALFSLYTPLTRIRVTDWSLQQTRSLTNIIMSHTPGGCSMSFVEFYIHMCVEWHISMYKNVTKFWFRSIRYKSVLIDRASAQSPFGLWSVYIIGRLCIQRITIFHSVRRSTLPLPNLNVLTW